MTKEELRKLMFEALHLLNSVELQNEFQTVSRNINQTSCRNAAQEARLTLDRTRKANSGAHRQSHPC